MLFGLELVALTKGQEADLEMAELEILIFFWDDKDGQNWELAQYKDIKGQKSFWR